MSGKEFESDSDSERKRWGTRRENGERDAAKANIGRRGRLTQVKNRFLKLPLGVSPTACDTREPSNAQSIRRNLVQSEVG